MDSTADMRRESKFSQENADFQSIPQFTPPGFLGVPNLDLRSMKDPHEFSHGNCFTIAETPRVKQGITTI
jgi:hypothetical protein